MTDQVQHVTLDLKRPPEEIGKALVSQVMKPLLQALRGRLNDEQMTEVWLAVLTSLSGGMSAQIGAEASLTILQLLQEIVEVHAKDGLSALNASSLTRH